MRVIERTIKQTQARVHLIMNNLPFERLNPQTVKKIIQGYFTYTTNLHVFPYIHICEVSWKLEISFYVFSSFIFLWFIGLKKPIKIKMRNY